MFFVEFLPEKQQKTSIIPRKNTGKGFDKKFKSGSETPRFLAIDTQRGGVLLFYSQINKNRPFEWLDLHLVRNFIPSLYRH